MSKHKKSVARSEKKAQAAAGHGKKAEGKGFPVGWMLALLAFTGALFSPILGNEFTNWDDPFYVLDNPLLRGPDVKGIFTRPVVSNYHPLTVLSLALNYRLSGLSPFSYFLVNGLLHVANTGLVFYFSWLLSERRRWVALFVGTVFAVHPLHVESVAWISERKDVLYTFFYLLGLIAYWRYVSEGRRSEYGWTLVWFAASLLSKPAAVAFPLTLLVLDYWKGRPMLQGRLWWEKAPFFALAAAMGVLTLLIQSEKAMASLELYSLTDRLFFGCYTLLAYVWRFFWPWPLSPFHPYPPADEMGFWLKVSPVLLLAAAGGVFYLRRHRALVFGLLFYLANIILVAQFISIGNTLLAERYTYVPYIGIAFALAMLVELHLPASMRQPVGWVLLALAAAGYGYLTFRYLDTWKNTERLWDTALRHAPLSPVPRSNRAHYYYIEALKPANAPRYNELMKKAAEDCDIALKSNPQHFASLDIRALVHIRLGEPEKALPLAERMVSLAPWDPQSHIVLGTALQRLKRYDEAIAAFNHALRLAPDNAEALNGRGASLFNGQQKYREALADFDRAIALQPSNGMAHLNRSRCYFMLGDKERAKQGAEVARSLGTPVPDDYWQLLQQ